MIGSLRDFNILFNLHIDLEGQQWTSVVMEDARYTNALLLDGLQFLCEDHFDVRDTHLTLLSCQIYSLNSLQQITNDFDKKYHFNSSVEYTTKAGIVPSLNLTESKLNIENKVMLL